MANAPFGRYLRSLRPTDTEADRMRKLLQVYDLRGFTRVRKQDEDLDRDDDDIDDLVDSVDERDGGNGGDGSEGSSTSRHISHLADMIAESAGVERQTALSWLLNHRNGLALLNRTLGKRLQKETTPMQTGIAVKVAKAICDVGRSRLTEHEISDLIFKHAQVSRRDGETPAQAFSRVFLADTDEGFDFRKAVQIAKGQMVVRPTQVGGDAAQAVDDPEDALAQLEELADEQRRRSPQLSKAAAFAKVYSDPANAALAAKERRQNRPHA